MSPRRKDPELADRRREALVKAGYAEILEKGIQALTIDSVVARAESSKGGALYYFHTKEDLLYAVLEWLLAEMSRALDDIAEGGGSPRARISAELQVLFHSAEVNRKFYLVLFDLLTLAGRADRFRALVAGFFEECMRRDTRIVEEGIKRGEFRRVSPRTAAATLRALVDGYCLQWLMNPEETPIEAYRDRCREVLGAFLLR
jgi:AcrR family transcriptional regulator